MMTWFAVVLFLKTATERADDNESVLFLLSLNICTVALHAPSLTFFVVSMLLLVFFFSFLCAFFDFPRVVIQVVSNSNSKSPFDLFAPTSSAITEDSSDFEGMAPSPPTATFMTRLLPLVFPFVAAKAAWR